MSQVWCGSNYRVTANKLSDKEYNDFLRKHKYFSTHATKTRDLSVFYLHYFSFLLLI